MNGVTLKNNTKNTIPISKLKDGQLAVIVSWAMSDEYNGVVVQRYKDKLIAIGKRSGLCWGDVFNLFNFDEVCRVRVLEPGEIITVN